MVRFPAKQLRKVSESLMPTRCQIVRTVRGAPSPYGGYEDPTENVDNTRCRIEAGAGREGVLSDALRSTVNARVYLPFGTEIDSKTTIRTQGREFNVEYVSVASDEFSADIEVFVSDVR